MSGNQTGGRKGFLARLTSGNRRNLLVGGATGSAVIALVAVAAFALGGGNETQGIEGLPEVFVPAQAPEGGKTAGQPEDDRLATSSSTTGSSDDPAATATTVAGQTVAVPDIIGLFHLTASVRLGDAGVEYGKTAVCEDESRSTLVLSQDPAPGAVVELGSIVNFTYQNSSPCGPLPDLGGLNEAEARDAWAAAGFVPQFLSFTNRRCHDETFGEGLVWWHTGEPGILEPLQFAHMTAYINEACP